MTKPCKLSMETLEQPLIRRPPASLATTLLRNLSITVFGVSVDFTSIPFSFAIRRRLLVINPGTPPSSTVDNKSFADFKTSEVP